VVDFLVVIVELFSLSLMIETLQAEICRSRRFSKGMGHSERKDTQGAFRKPTSVRCNIYTLRTRMLRTWVCRSYL